MPYKPINIDTKIEQLQTTAKGYAEIAARTEELPMRNHYQYWADFMNDLSEDIKHLKTLIEKEVENV